MPLIAARQSVSPARSSNFMLYRARDWDGHVYSLRPGFLANQPSLPHTLAWDSCAVGHGGPGCHLPSPTARSEACTGLAYLTFKTSEGGQSLCQTHGHECSGPAC